MSWIFSTPAQLIGVGWAVSSSGASCFCKVCGSIVCTGASVA